MNSDLIKNIIKAQIGYNEQAGILQISMCNVKLKQMGLPEIPTNYAEVLKLANGFSNEGVLIFGAEIKNNNWFKDITDYNSHYFKKKTSNWLILGADDWFYFIYDKKENKYCIIDQDTFEAEVISDNFEEPLSWILHLDAV